MANIRHELAAYQLSKLRETIAYASLHSPFYRHKLSPQAHTELASLADMGRFPFTTAEELRDEGLRFLCVSQDEISRVVTLSSSGTTGAPKRVFFTADDQDLAVDFFQCGTANLAEKGDRVLVLLPGDTPGSVGDLLAAGIGRFEAVPVRHGMIRSLAEALRQVIAEGVSTVIGIPVQVLALARYAEAEGIAPRIQSGRWSPTMCPPALLPSSSDCGTARSSSTTVPPRWVWAEAWIAKLMPATICVKRTCTLRSSTREAAKLCAMASPAKLSSPP